MKIMYGKLLMWRAALFSFGLTVILLGAASILYITGVTFLVPILLVCATCTLLVGIGAICSYCKERRPIEKPVITVKAGNQHNVVKTSTQENHKEIIRAPSPFKPSPVLSKKNSRSGVFFATFTPPSTPGQFSSGPSETVTDVGTLGETESEYVTPSAIRQGEIITGLENHSQTQRPLNAAGEAQIEGPIEQPVGLFGKDLADHKKIFPGHSVSRNGTPVLPLSTPTPPTTPGSNPKSEISSHSLDVNILWLDTLFREGRMKKGNSNSSPTGSIHSHSSPSIQPPVINHSSVSSPASEALSNGP